VQRIQHRKLAQEKKFLPALRPGDSDTSITSSTLYPWAPHAFPSEDKLAKTKSKPEYKGLFAEMYVPIFKANNST